MAGQDDGALGRVDQFGGPAHGLRIARPDGLVAGQPDLPLRRHEVGLRRLHVLGQVNEDGAGPTAA
ncbi:MAG: hypothetical protein D6759_10075, partial [Chloroflexi bacterium]